MDLTKEVTRVTYVGAITVGVFSICKNVLEEDNLYTADLDKPGVPVSLDCQRVRERLRCDLKSLLTVDDLEPRFTVHHLLHIVNF